MSKKTQIVKQYGGIISFMTRAGQDVSGFIKLNAQNIADTFGVTVGVATKYLNELYINALEPIIFSEEPIKKEQHLSAFLWIIIIITAIISIILLPLTINILAITFWIYISGTGIAFIKGWKKKLTRKQKIRNILRSWAYVL